MLGASWGGLRRALGFWRGLEDILERFGERTWQHFPLVSGKLSTNMALLLRSGTLGGGEAGVSGLARPRPVFRPIDFCSSPSTPAS